MFFNSLSFAVFLPIVFVLYWFVFNKNKASQNAVLIVASYYFYSCWDWRFLFLLVFSTFLDYYTGLRIEKGKTEWGRKFWFWLSIIVNLGFLGVFKYYNFFASSLSESLNAVGLSTSPLLLNVVLPVGISFYTFHGLSYVIDIYLKRIKAETNFVDYSLFVSYFPLLVAGPIERATHLLPQVKIKRHFDFEKAKEGVYQFLWGLVKKVVIADTCATYANAIFDYHSSMNSLSLILGAVYFAFQIYGDFSGYSDMALGMSKLFGIDLLRNFNYPYFSRDIAEFWRRWHISLSSWFRDYLYIPLGGSKGGMWMKIRNTFIIFLVSGFWHGANWTFIFWGLLNAIYIMPSIITGTNRKNMEIVAKGRFLPTFKELISITATFLMAAFAWIFFRAVDLSHAFDFIAEMCSPTLFAIPEFPKIGKAMLILGLTGIFMLVEWIGRENQYAIAALGLKWPRILRWGMYYLIMIAIFIFAGEEQEFIYFQF